MNSELKDKIEHLVVKVPPSSDKDVKAKQQSHAQFLDIEKSKNPHGNYTLLFQLTQQNDNGVVFVGRWTGGERIDRRGVTVVREGASVIVKRCYNRLLAHNEIDILSRYLMVKSNPFQDFFAYLLMHHQVDVRPEMFELDLVFTYCGDDLHRQFVERSVFGEDDKDFALLNKRMKSASEVCTKIVICAVKMHALHITHNDIKPENFVVLQDVSDDNSTDAPLQVRAIDWGVACKDTSHIASTDLFDEMKYYTPFFMHPHLVYRGQKTTLFKNDLWALGQTCFHIFTQQQPRLNGAQANEDTYGILLDLFLNDVHWDDKIFIAPELRNHELFQPFVNFVSRLCNISLAPAFADMELLQDRFLVYWQEDSLSIKVI